MTTLEQDQESIWCWLEKGVIFLFISIILVALVSNFTKYAWQHNGFELYNEFVWWLFDIKIAWGFKALAVYSAVALIPLSIASFVLLIISIINPIWFKIKFRVKFWYSIFISQILTWILIYSH